MQRLNRKQSRKRTRDRLLISARDVFARDGFAGASLDRIAEQAGYSKGAVYSNFEGKEALFLELLRERMSEELRELRQLLGESGSLSGILRALRRRYSTLEKQVVWCRLSTEFQLHAGRDARFAEDFAALYRDQRRAIANLVTLAAEKAGAKLAWDAGEIAISLMALTHGIALQRAADPASVPAATAGKAIELLLTAAFGVKADAPNGNRGMRSSRRRV